MLEFVAAMMMSTALASAPTDAGQSPLEGPIPVEGVEVQGTKPPIRVSRREIAILKKKLNSNPNAVICKRRQLTGSRFIGPPVCKTNIEWDMHETEKRRNLDRMLSNQWVRPGG